MRRHNNFFIKITSSLYAWLDLSAHFIQVSACQALAYEQKDLIEKNPIYFNIYMSVKALPLFVFSTFIAVHLSYLLLAEADSTKEIHTVYDINYVLNLFEKNKTIHRKQGQLFKDMNEFRFSSRFLSAIMVTLVVLYYATFYLSYFLIYWKDVFVNKTKAILKIVILALNLLKSNYDSMSLITLNDAVSKHYDFILIIFLVAFMSSFVICIFQIVLLCRDVKLHIKQMYKGNYNFVKRARTLRNFYVLSNSSFHFNG